MMIWKGIVPFFFIIPFLGWIYRLLFQLEFEIILIALVIITPLVYEYIILFSLYSKIDSDLENEKQMLPVPLMPPCQCTIFAEDLDGVEINNDPGVQT
jgi:hypothetical protein